MPTEHKIAYRKSDRVAAKRSFEVLEESGWYNPPVTGTYTIICIGAGGGGAGSFPKNDAVLNGQFGHRGDRVEMEVFLTKGQAVPYIIGVGGKGGASCTNEFVSHPYYSGSNGGTTIFDNQVSANGGNGGVSGSADITLDNCWYIEGSLVNPDMVGMRLWSGSGGVGGTHNTDGRPGHDGCIVVIHPAEPIEN